ncbi:helix-turn-helix domain-containing protein [Klebsiella variicola subsp. variicola]|nr:helix-turn-helix domain-containing protein [Klebsiella variicola subsp. variicola]
MARVSISEAARLTGKSRTTLHRLIKAGDLSTCSGERNAKNGRYFRAFACLWSL